MPLLYKKGDLLRAAKAGEVDAIAHCCNCFCTMGSGIAPQIKNMWPEVYEADLATSRGDPKKLGTFTKAIVDEGCLHVYNLYGQFGYFKRKNGGRDLDYNALFNALCVMGRDCIAEGIKTVGLPKIGAGLAGGDWRIISLLIEVALVEKNLDVIIYEYE